VVTRDDGVSFQIKGVAHGFAIPHDLAHFLVEKALRLHQGFWGSIADGAVFPSMRHAAGRRKPHATERSNTVLKANARALTEAEVLVRIFNDTIEQGHDQASPLLNGLLKDRWAAPGRRPRDISEKNIADVFASYKEMLLKWRGLPVDGTLDLLWPN
jgi:hypothetical protein